MFENETNIHETKQSYELIFEGIAYLITLTLEQVDKEDNIRINVSLKDLSQIKVTNNFNKNVYYFEKLYSLNDLYELAKEFKCCDTVDDVFSLFKDLFQNQNVKLKSYINQYNNILCQSLLLKLSTPGGKHKECVLELDPKYYDKDEVIIALAKKIVILQN